MVIFSTKEPITQSFSGPLEMLNPQPPDGSVGSDHMIFGSAMSKVAMNSFLGCG